MTGQPLEELARRAAAGDAGAADLFLDRLRGVLRLLDRGTLQKAVRSTLVLADELSPEQMAQARRPLTPEEVTDAVRELEILREQVAKGGGLELKDFLSDLEKMVLQP
jgi:hypothetical protein